MAKKSFEDKLKKMAASVVKAAEAKKAGKPLPSYGSPSVMNTVQKDEGRRVIGPAKGSLYVPLGRLQRDKKPLYVASKSKKGEAGKLNYYVDTSDGEKHPFYEEKKKKESKETPTVVAGKVVKHPDVSIGFDKAIKKIGANEQPTFVQETPNAGIYKENGKTYYAHRMDNGEIEIVNEESYNRIKLADKGKDPNNYSLADRFTDTVIGTGKQTLNAHLANLDKRSGPTPNPLDAVKNTPLAYKGKGGKYYVHDHWTNETFSFDSKEKAKKKAKELETIYDTRDQKRLDKRIADAQKKQQKSMEQIETAKIGASAGEKVGLDVLGAGTGLAADIGIGRLTGAGTLLTMQNRAAGGSYLDAKSEGASEAKAFLYSELAGITEAATEKMWSVGKAIPGATKVKGFFNPDKVLKAEVPKLIKSSVGRDAVMMAKKFGLAATTEGAEEVVAGIIQPILRERIYAQEEELDWKAITKEALYEGFIGAILGGGFGAVDVGSSIQQGMTMRQANSNEEIINKGLSTPEDSKTFMLATQLKNIVDTGGDLGNLDVSALQRAYQEEKVKQVKAYKKKQAAADGAIIREMGELPESRDRADFAYLKQGRTDTFESDRFGKVYNESMEILAEKVIPPELNEEQRAAAEREIAEDALSISRIAVGQATVFDFDVLMGTNPAARETFEQVTRTVLPQSNKETMEFLNNYNADSRILAASEGVRFHAIQSAQTDLGTKGFSGFGSIVDNYTPQEIPYALDSYKAAWTRGNLGAESIDAGSEEFKYLSPVDRMKAFQAGRIDREDGFKRAEPKTQETSRKAKKKTAQKKTGGLTEEGGFDKSSAKYKEYRKQKIVLEAAAKIYGVDIVVVDHLDTGKGENAEKINGKYEGGKIYLSVNAVDKSMLDVFKHEFTHHLRKTAPEAYRDLQDFVFRKFYDSNLEKYNKAIADKMAQYSKANVPLDSMNDAMEELMADAAMEFLQSEESIREFIKENQTAAEKVLSVLKEMITKFKELIQGQALHPENQWLRDLGILEEAEALWIKAAKESRGVEVADSGESKYQVDKYFERRMDDVYADFKSGKKRYGSIRVGTPSEALLLVGVPDNDIYFDESKIQNTFKTHKEVDNNTMKNIVDVLENPIVIAESYDQTVLAFGELFDEHGNPIVVAVRIDCESMSAGIEYINKIRSVGSRKKNLDNLLDEKKILYLNKSKKKTNAWFRDLGRFTPFGGTKFGLIRRISNTDDKVNSTDTKFSLSSPVEETKALSAQNNDTINQAAKDTGVKFSLTQYTEHEKQNWKSSKKIIIYESEKQLEDFIDEAWNGGIRGEKMYFGKIDGSLAATIKDNTGVDVDGYNLTLRAFEVSKIKNDHGDAKAEALRGQRPMTKLEVKMAQHVIMKPDKVILGKADRDGRPAIKFEQNREQRTVVVTLSSRKHKEVIIHTMYGGANKNNPSTATDARSPVSTSETNSGTGVDNNISRKSEKSNQNAEEKKDIQYSLPTVLDMEKQNLKDKIEALKAETRLTHGKVPDEGEIRKEAKRIHKEWLLDLGSGITAKDIEQDLADIYRMMQTGKQTDNIEEIYEKLIGLTDDIMADGFIAADEFGADGGVDLAKQMKSWLRNTPFYMNESEKADVSPDGFGRFRKENFGRMNIVNKKGGLNPLSQEESSTQDLDSMLVEMYETIGDVIGYVSSGMSPSDGLTATLAFIDANENPKPIKVPGDEAKYFSMELADSIFNMLNAVPPKQTFADKKKAEKVAAVKKEKEKAKVGMAKVREDALKHEEKQLRKARKRFEEQKQKAKDRQHALIEKLKENHRMRLKIERAKGKERIDLINERNRAHQEEMNERAKARLERKKVMTRIEKNSNILSDMLVAPTDKRHIPEGYRRAVADLLSGLNFANTRTDAWEAKYGRKSKRMLRFQQLAAEYAKINESEAGGIEPDSMMQDMLQNLSDKVDGKRLAELTDEELAEVDIVIRAMRHQVSQANHAFNQNIKENIEDLGEAVIMEFTGRDNQKITGGLVGAVRDAAVIYNAKPVDFFDRIGGTLQKLFDQIVAAEDNHIRNLARTMEYIEDMKEGYGKKELQKWSSGKGEKLSFTLTSGKKIDMIPSQVMSLYALNKREQARGHILGSGIVIAPVGFKNNPLAKATVGNKISKEKVFLTHADVQNILGSLTDKQMEVADAMIKYMNEVCSGWGNETSQKLYGYDKFNEPNYFPIKSNKMYLEETSDKKAVPKLKNVGFTKSTVARANNPIEIMDFFDVVTNHINTMSMYNTFVPAVTDFERVYNYNSKGERGIETSVKYVIDQKLGQPGLRYISKLLEDINNQYQRDSEFGVADWLLRNWKATKIGANARVLIQQPTAMTRAQVYIDYKYLAAGMTKRFTERKYKQRMWEIAPIAQWKHWGFAQTDISRDMSDIIMGNDNLYNKAVFGVYGWADDIAWAQIFAAVEKETQAEHPELEYDSEEYRAHVNERFRYIVDRTQVVDSVLHRSHYMRDQNWFMRSITSFMAEPTTQMNMWVTALTKTAREIKAGNKKEAARTFTRFGQNYLMSMAVLSIAASLISAMRESWTGDDDDEEYKDAPFVEKWFKQYFTDDITDNMNPLNQFPWARDVMSLINGYKVERVDMSMVNDAVTAAKNWKNYFDKDGNVKYSKLKLARDAAEAGVAIFGIPLKNMNRDIEMMTKTFFRATGNKAFADFWMDKLELNPAYDKNRSTFIDHYIKAMENEDTELARDTWNLLEKNDIDVEKINDRIWRTIGEDYKEDLLAGHDVSVTESTLRKVGIDPETLEEKKERYLSTAFNDAVRNLDQAEISRYGQLLKDYFDYTDDSIREKVERTVKGNYYDAIDEGNTSTQEDIKQLLYSYGYTDQDINYFEGMHYKDSYRRRAYLELEAGNTSAAYAIAKEYTDKYPGMYKKGPDGMIRGFKDTKPETIARWKQEK
jgi:hypothetical protein